MVNHTVILGLFCCHPIVAVGVCPHFVEVCMAVVGDDGIKLLFKFLYFAGGNLNV